MISRFTTENIQVFRCVTARVKRSIIVHRLHLLPTFFAEIIFVTRCVVGGKIILIIAYLSSSYKYILTVYIAHTYVNSLLISKTTYRPENNKQITILLSLQKSKVVLIIHLKECISINLPSLTETVYIDRVKSS